MGTSFGGDVASLVSGATSNASVMFGQLVPFLSVFVALGVVALAVAVFRKASI